MQLSPKNNLMSRKLYKERRDEDSAVSRNQGLSLENVHKFNELIDVHATLLGCLKEIQTHPSIRNGPHTDDNGSNKRAKYESSFSVKKILTCDAIHDLGVTADIFIHILEEESKLNEVEITTLATNYVISALKEIIFEYKKPVGDYKSMLDKVVIFVEILLRKKIVTTQDISQLLMSHSVIEEFPLLVTLKLSKLSIVSMEQILIRRVDGLECTRLVQDILDIIIRSENYEDGPDIVQNFIATLLMTSYCLPKDNNYATLKSRCNKLLTQLTKQLLDRLDLDGTFSPSECTDKLNENLEDQKDILNIYDIALNMKTMEAKSLHQFLTDQLVLLLTYKPVIPVSLAIREQDKWRSTKVNKNLSKMIFSIIVGIGHISAFDTLDMVVSTLEVNWGIVLTFLSTLLLVHRDSSSMLRELILKYIHKGCNLLEVEFLLLGFLLARHAAQEGRHVFSSYLQWFGAVFGSESTTPASTKRSFVFLIRFLTELVPYDTPACLRAHIHQAIFVPKNCQAVMRDYQHLARAQIQHLTSKNLESADPHTMMIDQRNIRNEVKAAAEQFEKCGKLPSVISDTSIFRKNFFIKSFLPNLLEPRHIPDVPDSKMKLIWELLRLEKLPQKTYDQYLENCKKMTAETSVPKQKTVMSAELLENLGLLLDEYSSCQMVLRVSTDKEQSKNSKVLELLSRISHNLEALSSTHDSSFKSSTCVNIEEEETKFSPLREIVNMILKCLRKWFDSLPNENRMGTDEENSFSQLLSIVAVSPALQITLFGELLALIKSSVEEDAFENNTTFIGVLLGELKPVEGMFLNFKSSASEDKSGFIELLVKKLPISTVKECLASCSILSGMIARAVHQGSADTLNYAIDMYVLLSPRLAAMEEECRKMNVTLTPSDAFRCAKVPTCSKLFFDFSAFFSSRPPSLEKWLSFEMRTEWGCTSLDSRMTHLHYWLSKYYLSSKKIERDTFFSIFWSLVESNSYSKNSAEVLLLLRGVGREDGGEEALLDMWNGWKRAKYEDGQQNGNLAKKLEYHSHLLHFTSLCRCLPNCKFFNVGNWLQSSKYFGELVSDILELDGTLYLGLCDTSYYFECLMQIAQYQESTATHIQRCLSHIQDSILFHWRHIMTPVSRYRTLFDKFSATKMLVSVDPYAQETWDSLSPKQYAIMALSMICNNDEAKIESITIPVLPSDSDRIYMLLPCVSFLGNVLMRGSESRLLPEITRDSPDESRVRKRLVQFCLLLLNRIAASSLDPLKMMTTFKSECSSVPLAWKSCLFGLVFLLLKALPVGRSPVSPDCQVPLPCQVALPCQVPRFLSLIICSFTSLAALFEESGYESDPEVNLSYLSRLNKAIFSLIEMVPLSARKDIPSAVIVNCDREMKAAICQSKGLPPTCHLPK